MYARLIIEGPIKSLIYSAATTVYKPAVTSPFSLNCFSLVHFSPQQMLIGLVIIGQAKNKLYGKFS